MKTKNPYLFGQQANHGTPEHDGHQNQHVGTNSSNLSDLLGASDEHYTGANFSGMTNPGGATVDSGAFVDSPKSLSDEELNALTLERICPSCAVKQEADETRLRAMAELENTRKRLIREKEEHVAYAAEAVLSDIIPALDNLDLALEHAKNMDACKDLVIGVEMTKKILLDSLKKHGLEAVGIVGECFDPAQHEAVGTENNPEVNNNDVCRLLSKGYKLKGRLLRPARVVVSKK